jgi:hypothetical protein
MIVIRKVRSSLLTKFNQPRGKAGEFSDLDWDKKMNTILKDPVYRKIDPDGWRTVVDRHFGRDAVNRELGAIAKYSPPPKQNPQSIQKNRLNPKLLLAGLAATTAVGAGAYFIRKRKSKNGKQIIERVKR